MEKNLHGQFRSVVLKDSTCDAFLRELIEEMYSFITSSWLIETYIYYFHNIQ